MSFEDGSWTVLYLNPSHLHCQLSNYDWAGRPTVQAMVTEFVQQMAQKERPHLILSGPPGTGKTHLGVGLYRMGVKQSDTIRSVWLHVPTFCDQVKSAYDKPELLATHFDMITAANHVLVLDDIFGRQLTAHELDHIVFRLIDNAHKNNAALVITMNHTLDEMRQILNPHEVSRILDGVGAIAELRGKDWRPGK